MSLLEQYKAHRAAEKLQIELLQAKLDNLTLKIEATKQMIKRLDKQSLQHKLNKDNEESLHSEEPTL